MLVETFPVCIKNSGCSNTFGQLEYNKHVSVSVESSGNVAMSAAINILCYAHSKLIGCNGPFSLYFF